jgi:hypothetical protein
VNLLFPSSEDTRKLTSMVAGHLFEQRATAAAIHEPRRECAHMEVSMRQFIAVFSIALVCLVSRPAAAQVVGPLDSSETYIPIIQFQSGGSVCFSDGFCITERNGIPLNILATVTQLNALTDRIDTLTSSFSAFGSQLSAFSARLTSELSSFNSRLTSIDESLVNIEDDLSDAIEGVAMAAALKDAMPNAGDRFGLRLNAAGFSGEFAGAVGFAANVAERARIHVNYGRSRSQNTVSGGVNLSFR